MPLDHSSWQTQQTAKIDGARNDFLNALDDDKNFIDTYDSFIAFDYKDMFQNPMTIALESVQEVSDAIQGIAFTLPEKPVALTSDNIRKKAHVFDDVRLDTLESKMKEVYAAIGDKNNYKFNQEQLDQAIQTALYSVGYNLDEEEVRTELSNMAASWAADGYTNPPGAMSFDMAETISKFDRSRTAKNEGVFASLANTIQENIQQTFEAGRSIEKLHMDFANKYSELSRTVVETAVDVYITEINKRKDEMFASLSNVSSLTKALRLDVEADIKKTELELKEEISRVNAHVANFVSFIAAEADLVVKQIGMAQNVANGYQAVFKAYGGAFNAVSYEQIAKE